MEEIWKPVVGYEGYYEVSNLGNVKTLRDSTKHRNGDRLNIDILNSGYNRVTLCVKNITFSGLTHRLVAKAFIPNPENKEQVNHKNGIKSDNRLENLEWCTRSENGLHSFRILGNKSFNKGRYGELSTRGKKVAQYDLDMNFIRYFGSTREVERILGFSRTGVSDCCTGKAKKSNGYIWKYAI